MDMPLRGTRSGLSHAPLDLTDARASGKAMEAVWQYLQYAWFSLLGWVLSLMGQQLGAYMRWKAAHG